MATPQRNEDRYAQESFTWRRMKPWQIWTLAIAAVALVVAGVIYLA